MARPAKIWKHRTGELVLDRTRVMGVLNVTPDSFSDGGLYFEPDAAIRRGEAMIEEGADLIDIGGESTRPRSDPVPAAEEWRRVRPVFETLGRKVDVPLSIDTMKPEVAEKAIHMGASIVNDVSGLQDPAMIRLLATARVGAVAMHMRGNPKTMQEHPQYADVVGEVKAFLATRISSLEAAGLPSEAIAIDPGVGFGKSLDHNLALLRELDQLAGLGHPVVVGVSRKSFIGKLGAGEPGERLPGSLAAAVLAVSRGANVVRAHDVLETVRALSVADAVLRTSAGPGPARARY
ncbi:MAG TPA: dihydropteroate synthase [Thermoplasmata archaeon]|nr:dihydropteroate synthase [Thermoplasmata archaeon]